MNDAHVLSQLSQEYEQEVARQIQAQIDREILFDILIECGWSKIALTSEWSLVSAADLHQWCEQNLTGKYQADENIWLFEKSQDAIQFALRWA